MLKEVNAMKGSRMCRPIPSRGGGVLKVIVILLLVIGIGAGIWGWRVKSGSSSKKVNLIYATAERGVFVHEVNGKGSAESAKNVDVASQVEGQATVIYLIPEGTDVKKGDLLVELDSSDVDEKLDSQVVTTNSSRATLNSSRATLRSAEISLEEYVEGTFEQNWMEYENTIFEAEQTRKQNADSARFTERLLNLNYSTELQYEIDKVAEEKAKNSLEVANLKKMTLLKYTSEKQITSLMSDIETAKAKVDSDKNSYNINLNRENRYREISANCKIKAPQDGQVVYANQDSRRMSEADMIKEGSTVRQRQVLVRLPDKTQMQVKTMINESNISSVKVGMPAKITFDSIPGKVIEGEVVKVNLYPEIVWMSSAKDYVTLVKINENIEELRSGLTAQVRIIADEQKDVLMVPVHCVTEYGNKTYCVTYKDGVWGYKEVLLGASNEKQIIVLAGLNEGDQVVSGARNYRDNVTFPDPSSPSDFEDNEIYQQKLAEKEAEREKNASIEAGVGDSTVAGGPGGGMPKGVMGGPGAESMSGGMPGMGNQGGGAPKGAGGPGGAGMSQEMMSAIAEKIKSGEIPADVMSRLPGGMGKGPGRGGALSADEVEELQKRREESVVYAKTIEERLAHDARIADIEPFFNRTVMEMQRELLAAIDAKTSALQARIAARQSEITRRQEEIELLQKTSNAVKNGEAEVVASTDGESVDEKIERLTKEIQALRGDSDVPVLERVAYLDQIDWNKYVSGNDVTKEAINFLSESADDLFESLFPNSQVLDVVEKESGSENDATSDEDALVPASESELASTGAADYSAFLPLFEVWDTNHDGRLKPTEFVIGFFSDRKSFQDSESDESIDELFAEYARGNESDKDDLADVLAISEIPMKDCLVVADRILRERAEATSGSGRRNGGARGGNGGPRGPLGAQKDLPTGAPESAENGGSEKGKFPPIAGMNPPADGSEGLDMSTPPKAEPIKDLSEASSIKQAVAFYLDRMDFNNDGLLQKTEFVKGYHEINDAAGKLFLTKNAINAVDNSSPMEFGPPPR